MRNRKPRLTPRVLTPRALLAGVAAFGLAGYVAGCATGNAPKENVPVRPVSSQELEKMHAERTDFDKAKDPPITADTRFAAGQLAESQQAWPGAIEQYNRGLNANPNHVGCLYRLGVVYTMVKKYPEAIGTWKRYVKVTHDSAVGYSNLGFCYELSGQFDEAERAYTTGISRDSESAPCRVNYGLMLARRGRIAEAARQLQSVLTQAEVHYNLASVYESQGRKEQARDEYQRAIELDPKLRDAQARLKALSPASSAQTSTVGVGE